MARERDFFRLNKKDQEDLNLVLSKPFTITEALRDIDEHDAVDAFHRLADKFYGRLVRAKLAR